MVDGVLVARQDQDVAQLQLHLAGQHVVQHITTLDGKQLEIALLQQVEVA